MSKTRSRFWTTLLLVVTMLLVSVSSVWSGGWVHTSHGPFGGVIQALARDVTGRLYVATYRGWIFVSIDGGENWTLSKSGIANSARNIQALAAASDGTVYAGSSTGGVYKTTNGGGSWTAMNTGLGDSRICALLIDPASPTTLYAGTCGSGVYKWTPSTWQAMNTGALSANVYTLAMDSSSVLHLGRQNDGANYGVYYWDGAQWQAQNNGLPANSTVRSLLAVGTNLWAGTEGNGVYYWAGSSWAARNTGLSGDALNVRKISADGNGEIYAGTEDAVFHWTGSAWETRDTGLEGNGRIVRDLVSPGGSELFAGSDGRGVYYSADGGLAWTEKNNGLSGYVVRAVAINPQYDWRIYAGTYRGGIFWSPNGGESWARRSEGLGDVEVEALVVTQPSGSPVYAGLSGQGVYRSDDLGALWVAKNTGLTGNALLVNDLAIKPIDNSQTIYAGTEDGVYRSVDSGEQWTQRCTALPYTVSALAVDPRPGKEGILYIGTAQNGVYLSEDEGGVCTLLPGLSGDAAMILSLVLNGDGDLLAGTEGGVYRYTGSSWELDGPSSPIHDLVVNPISTTVVYAGSAEGTSPLGVLQRMGPQNWQPFNTGIANYNVYALAIDDYFTQTLHAGTGGSSMWDYTFGDDPPPLAPEVGIDLDDGYSVIYPNQVLTYVLTYYNTGVVDAQNAAMTMTLPNFTEYLSSDPPFTPIGADQYLLITPTIPPESVQHVSFYVQVLPDPPYPPTVAAEAQIKDDGSSGPDPYLLNNQDDDIDLLQVGDLVLIKGAVPAPNSLVQAGDRITYTLTYHNIGVGDLTGVVLTDILPVEVTYEKNSIWPTPAGNDSNAPVLTWNLGSLAPGAQGTAGFIVTVNEGLPEGTIIANTFSGDSDQTTPQTSLPVEHIVQTEAGGVDLSCIALWADPDDPVSGDPFELWTTVHNYGNEDATGVTFWTEVYVKPFGSPWPTDPSDHYLGMCSTLACDPPYRYDYVEGLTGLGAGEEFTIHFSGAELVLPSVGNYVVFAQVDIAFAGDPTWGRYLESNENNNMCMFVLGGSIVHLPIVLKQSYQ